MTSTAAFFARLVGLLAAAVATLAIAVGVLGLPSMQATAPSGVTPDGVTAAGSARP